MVFCGSPRELKIQEKGKIYIWNYKHVVHLFSSFLFRDWLNMLSPPIVPPSQQPAEQHQDSSGSLSAQGGNMKNTKHKK